MHYTNVLAKQIFFNTVKEIPVFNFGIERFKILNYGKYCIFFGIACPSFNKKYRSLVDDVTIMAFL